MKPRKAYHHGNLRAALIEATLALVAERGARGFTLRDAARRAGVSHAAPYRHFADKDALLAAVAAEGFADLGRALAGGDGSDPGKDFADQGIAYVRWAVTHPAHYRIMFGDAISEPQRFPELAASGGAAFGALVAAIEANQKAGLMRRSDPMDLALAAWSSVHGLSSLLIDGRLHDVVPPNDPDAVQRAARTVTRLFGTGVARR